MPTLGFLRVLVTLGVVGCGGRTGLDDSASSSSNGGSSSSGDNAGTSAGDDGPSSSGNNNTGAADSSDAINEADGSVADGACKAFPCLPAQTLGDAGGGIGGSSGCAPGAQLCAIGCPERQDFTAPVCIQGPCPLNPCSPTGTDDAGPR